MRKYLSRRDQVINLPSAVLPFGLTVGLEGGEFDPVEAGVANPREGRPTSTIVCQPISITVSQLMYSASSAPDSSCSKPVPALRMNRNKIKLDGFSNPETERLLQENWDEDRRVDEYHAQTDCGWCCHRIFMLDSPFPELDR